MLNSRRSLAAVCAVSAGLWAILAGCASNRSADSDQIKVEVANVGVDKDGLPYVMLEDSAGGRELPIMIGESEAQSIAMELHGYDPGRPLTYDLIKNILDSTGNHVDRVEVNDLRDQTYFAIIVLDHGSHTIDSRPSDAIAVALAAKAPIYVSARLFDSGAMDVNAPDHTPAIRARPGTHGAGAFPGCRQLFLGQARQRAAGCRRIGAALRAGVARGDLLTAIDASQVQHAQGFQPRSGAAGARPDGQGDDRA